jgi:Protein of unknown function (DUF1579)
MSRTNLRLTACTFALAFITCLTTAPARAQQGIPKPTAEHALLKKGVGTWDAVLKIWPVQDAPPVEGKGTEKNELLPGGLWLVSNFDGQFSGIKFVGKGTYGYDPGDKKHVGTWVDSMTPYVVVTKGDYDPATKTMTSTAERRDLATGERYMTRQITRYPDDDNRIVEFHRLGKDDSSWKVMEIQYKRSVN